MFDKNVVVKTYSEININAVSGGIYKTYRESWFERFPLTSQYSDELLKKPNKDGQPIVLQMVVCGNMQVMVELINKEDLDNYLLEKGGN